MSTMNISPDDLINSFLATAKKKGISVTVIAGYQENNAQKMKLFSNVGEAGTRVALEWVCDKVLNKPVPQPPPTPDTPPTLPS